MTIKEELLFDFALNLPRILMSGELLVLDHVKRLVLLSEKQILVHNGKKYTSVEGENLSIKELRDERMLIVGEVEQLRFFETLYKCKD